MPKTWDEVAASPDFQSLPLVEKEQARTQYFNQVVAPNVPKEKRTQVLQHFTSDTQKSLDDDLSDQIPGSSHFDKKLGAWVKNATGEVIPASPQASTSEFERNLDAAGNAMMGVPMVGLGAGALLKGMGKAPQIASEAGKVAQFARPILEGMKPNSIGELAKMTASAGAAGAAGEMARSSAQNAGAGNLGQSLAEIGGGMATSLPGLAAGAAKRAVANIPRKTIQSDMRSSFAQEGADLSKDTGIPLTVGQQTGNKSVLFGENAARQSFLTADEVFVADKRQADAAVKRVREIADKINVSDLSKSGIGERLREAMKTSVEKVDQLRKKQGDADFSEVRRLAGGRPIINYGNTVAALNEIIAENEHVIADDARKVTTQAKRMLSELTEQQSAGRIVNSSGAPAMPAASRARTVDVEEARRNRSFWSRAAAGNGNVFSDVSPDANRVAAARLASAVTKDFEEASSAKTPVADALKKANRNYQDYSNSIRYIQSSVLGKLLGKEVADAAVTGAVGNTIAAEKVADAFMKMTPSEAKQVANILKVNHPQILSEAKSFVVRDALKKAMDLPVSAGAKRLPMSFNKMIKALPDKEYLAAVGFTNREVKEIDDVVQAMQRAGDRTGSNASGTAPVNQFFDMLGSLTGGVKRLGGTAVQATVMKTVAKAMTTEEGRKALTTLTKFDPEKQKNKEVMRAIAVVNSYQNRED